MQQINASVLRVCSNKTCILAGIEQPVENFNKKKNGKYGIKAICKKCCKEYNRQHYEKNRQKIKLLHKLYRESNQEIFLKYRQSHKEEAREYSKIYASTHKKEASYRAKNRRELDINYRLIVNLRTRITRAVKNNWKSGSAVRDLGCSIFELKKWLENTFKINVKTG